MIGKDVRNMKNALRTVFVCLASTIPIFGISGCSTAVAVVDVTASTAIYAGKTVVNTIDAVTPDIVN
jgi:hypothetical protein